MEQVPWSMQFTGKQFQKKTTTTYTTTTTTTTSTTTTFTTTTTTPLKGFLPVQLVH